MISWNEAFFNRVNCEGLSEVLGIKEIDDNLFQGNKG